LHQKAVGINYIIWICKKSCY